MADNTKIAWTTFTANFWMGCEKVSAGCKNCYAETLTRNRMGIHVWGARSRRQPVKGIWDNVRRWNKQAEAEDRRTRTFCMSLGDFFEDHPDCNELRTRAWSAIRNAPMLDWQILTKRPENIERMLPPNWGDGWPNVWLGTSIENAAVCGRANILRSIPAIVHFISYEPALGPIADEINLTNIQWLICGGESGPGYRPMNMQWARDIRDKCRREGTAFFFKQSSAPRTEMGIELDGEIVREYPTCRTTKSSTLTFTEKFSFADHS